MISFNPNLPQQPAITPFCDQNFKTLRILAEEVKRAHLQVFYMLASLFYWFFNKDLSFYCRSLDDYHVRIVDSTICRGSEVINFSINRPRYFQKPSSQIPVWEQLEDRYGKEEIDRWSHIRKMPLELKPERLSPNRGQCLGKSLDFAYHYLHLRKQGMAPLDAVKLVSSRYVAGAPKEAQLIQLFSHALVPRNDPMIENFLGLERASWSLNETRLSNSYVRSLTEKLSEEVYKVRLYCEGRNRHVILFIKTEEDCFILDPNYATFAVKPDEAIDRLRKIAQKYCSDKYWKKQYKDYYEMELTPLKLASLPLLEKRS